VRPGQQIVMEKGTYLVGCSAGCNRSQVARVFLQNHQCRVAAVIAGADSGINPMSPCLRLRPFDSIEQEQFRLAFNQEKVPQLGCEKFGSTSYTGVECVQTWEFYSNYFKNCEPLSVLGFAHTSPAVIKRLLVRTDSLKGFKIIHFDVNDEINYPQPPLTIEHSGTGEAYKAFYNKLKETLKFN
jgi:hypothetical protein